MLDLCCLKRVFFPNIIHRNNTSIAFHCRLVILFAPVAAIISNSAIQLSLNLDTMRRWSFENQSFTVLM